MHKEELSVAAMRSQFHWHANPIVEKSCRDGIENSRPNLSNQKLAAQKKATKDTAQSGPNRSTLGNRQH
jgi:hypothetical protein